MKKECAFLRFIYRTVPGRLLLRIVRSRLVSFVVGAFLDSPFSKFIIPKFVKKNGIDLTQYEPNRFRCFNDCFCRKIKPEYRPISPEGLIAPCDGLLSAYRIHEGTVLPIKQSFYTIPSLLKNEELARHYQNGLCLVFRLCVNNYHRYCYIDNGEKGENVRIRGVLNTVRPVALETFPVFTENTREYTVMETETLGKVTQVEVGALLIGKIKNLHGAGRMKRGAEKGYFLYGGSTIVLLIEEGRVELPEELFAEGEEQVEIPVQMGGKIGELPKGSVDNSENNLAEAFS